MANAQLLMYGPKHLEQNFFCFVFLNNSEHHAVLSDLEIPQDLKIVLIKYLNLVLLSFMTTIEGSS